MPNSRLPVATRLLVVVVAVSGWLAATGPTAIAAQSDAVFTDTTASAEFGEALRFETTVASDVPIVEVELYWWPEGDLEVSVSYPEFEPGLTIEIDHEVDLSFDWLPPGVDIHYFWRAVDARDNVSDSEEGAVFYMDDSQDWESITNGLVTVWWHAGADEFAGDILATASRTIESLGDRFEVEAREPIRLVIYGDDDAFADALPPNSADWIGGQAHPELNLIVAQISPGAGLQREIGRMIPHEVSHLILHQATENPWNSPPNWLDEGLAVYNQETADGDLPDILDEAVDEGRLIPVRALGSSFPLDPEQAYLSYAESHSIVTFVIEELGEEAMAALIAVFRDEVSYDEAVERALGMTVEELDAAWKAWIGYDGDRPPSGGSDSDSRPPAQTDPADDSDLSEGEWIFALACSGFFALAGLGLGIYSIQRARRIGRGN